MFKTTSARHCAVIGVAAMLGAAPAWAAGDTQIGGKIFANFTSIDAESDGVSGAASGLGVDVKRAYVTVGHKFDDIWSVNVTTDFQYASNDAVTQVYIKKLYVQAKLSEAFVVRAGSADLPWVTLMEDVYGYRYLEKVMVDRLNFGSSTDWGLNVSGSAGGVFHYSTSLLNGGGYKNPSRSKQMDLEGRVSMTPMDGLTIAAGIYGGKRGQKKDGGVPTPNTAQRMDLAVSYVKSGLRIGAEYFAARNWNNVTGATIDDKADGFSVWGSWDFNPAWGVFARGDSVKLSKNVNPGRENAYYHLGVVSHPRKNVDLALAYKHEKTSGGSGAVSNYAEVGAWVQVVF